MQTITLNASASFGHGGKQFVARVLGRDSKFTFNRQFIGRKEGKRGESTSVTVDEPGLYELRDIDRKGSTDDRYILIWRDGASLKKLTLDQEQAMADARKIEQGVDPNELGVYHTIAIHEEKIANHMEKDPAEILKLTSELGPYASGQNVTRRECMEWRRSEIARLRGEDDRASLIAEKEKLITRLTEIDALLAK